MSALPKPRFTPAEYLAFERKSPTKHEYYRGEIIPRAHSSFNHCFICTRLIVCIGNSLDGTPCRPLGSDMRIHIPATGTYAYPDVSVLYGKPELSDDEFRDILLNPTVIIEVLSPSTETYDRGEKFRQYKTITHMKEYVLFAQDSVFVDHFIRQGDGWLMKTYDKFEDVLAFTSVPASVTLKQIYDGIEFKAKNSPDERIGTE